MEKPTGPTTRSSDLFRIPNWEVHPHGFAEELLTCLTDIHLNNLVNRPSAHVKPAETVFRACQHNSTNTASPETWKE